MSHAIIAHMTLIERSQTGETDSFEPIPEAKGVGVPAVSQDYNEVTHNRSPDAFREWIKSLRDGGELAIKANYTSAGYRQQLQDRDHNGPIFYRTTFPRAQGQSSGDVFTFAGFPNPTIDASDEPGETVMMTITIRTTGSIGFEAGEVA